jgi:hypothetical protein
MKRNCSIQNEYVPTEKTELILAALNISFSIVSDMISSIGNPRLILSNSSMINRGGTLIKMSAKLRIFSLIEVSIFVNAIRRCSRKRGRHVLMRFLTLRMEAACQYGVIQRLYLKK